MISLRKSLEQMSDRERHQAAVQSFCTTLEASAQHAIEVDPREAGLYRSQMLALAAQLTSHAAQSDSPDYPRLATSIALELQLYGHKTSQKIARMRQDLIAAAAAMDGFAGGVEEGCGDYEKIMRQEMVEMQTAVEGDDLEQIRRTVLGSVAELEKSYLTMKQRNESVVAQLRDEIRTLQYQLEQNTYQPHSGPVKIMSASAFDERVEERIRSNKTFYVLMLGLVGLAQARTQHAPQVMERYLEQQMEALTSIVGEMGKVGAWNENVFLVLLDDSRARATKLSQRARAVLCEPVQIASREGTVELCMEVRTEAVERSKGESPASFYVMLGRAAEVVVRG